METQPAQHQAPPFPTTLSSPILSYKPQAGPTPPLDKLYTPQIRKTLSSYAQCRVERKAQVPSPSPDLGHPGLTGHPQIVSETGPRETNETQNSYKTLRRSYKRCLTQHPNRIWKGHFTETIMRRLVSPPANPPPALPACPVSVTEADASATMTSDTP